LVADVFDVEDDVDGTGGLDGEGFVGDSSESGEGVEAGGDFFDTVGVDCAH
jgi:hypothetical protein